MSIAFSLAGKNALVTGGDSGIGLATAKRLAVAGANVAIIGLKPADDIAAEFGGISLVCDVSNEEQVKATMAAAREKLGAAGYRCEQRGCERGLWRTHRNRHGRLRLQLVRQHDGVWPMVSSMAFPVMKDGGSIVNVVSVAGLQGVAYLSPYVASKYASIGITKTAAAELAPRRIRVNAVCPTSVNTPMAHAEGGEPQLRMERKAVPLGRIAEPEEVAALIHFLCADDCAFLNGQAIAVDGGFTAGMSITAYDALAREEE